jgi:hypothetical protein
VDAIGRIDMAVKESKRQAEQRHLLEEALRRPGVSEAMAVQRQLDQLAQQYQVAAPQAQHFATGGNR